MIPKIIKTIPLIIFPAATIIVFENRYLILYKLIALTPIISFTLNLQFYIYTIKTKVNLTLNNAASLIS